MFEEEKFLKLLNFLNKELYGDKVTDTNWNYSGLLLDEYFENSVLSIQYLDVGDYMQSTCGMGFDERNTLEGLYGKIEENKRLKCIEALYNVLFLTHYKNDNIEKNIQKIKAFLLKQGVKIVETENVGVNLEYNNKIGDGAYADIFIMENGLLKKKIKEKYVLTDKITKRLNYEYDMMEKLSECLNVIKVYEYNKSENYIIMEKCDENLYQYLETNIDISDSQKLKIIKDLLSGMKFAHDIDIIHRDLHLGNILRKGNDFLICDFGLGKDENQIKSLISSSDPKNSHFFIDPIGLKNFKKLDKKSDIYSIGKIIDYIMSDGTESKDHIFSYIVTKCTARTKEERYNKVDDIIENLDRQINDIENSESITLIVDMIKHGICNDKVKEYIYKCKQNNILCNLIVTNRLNNIGSILINYDISQLSEILKSISQNFVEATGYMGFANYDIFADIMNYLIKNIKDYNLKKICIEILEICAGYRVYASKIYTDLQTNNYILA